MIIISQFFLPASLKPVLAWRTATSRKKRSNYFILSTINKSNNKRWAVIPCWLDVSLPIMLIINYLVNIKIYKRNKISIIYVFIVVAFYANCEYFYSL